MRRRIPDSQDAGDHTAEAVGYGRPPSHTRFKPGQSGNPKGRRKNRKNLSTLLLEVLDEKLPIREGDRTKTVSKAEAMIRATVIKALKGDAKSVHMLVQLLEKIRQEEKSEPRRCVIRAPAPVKDIDEWFERYAPKEVLEERAKRRQSSAETISDSRNLLDNPVREPEPQRGPR
jgi:Family of unknown function (DUF5681)